MAGPSTDLNTNLLENENTMNEDDDGEFQESVLGTKEFWEDSFKRDFLVYQQRYEIDDVWFGQESVDRVARWLEARNTDKSSSILDIGCGNGATLIALAESGYTKLFGIDYASSAIELATAIAREEEKSITFQVCDFLQNLDENPNKTSTTASSAHQSDPTNNTKEENMHTANDIKHPFDPLSRQYDVCLDKGTYDAICLNPVDRTKQRLRYQENVARVCKDGGIFLLTSCNWTRDELIDQFNSQFKVIDQIPTATFQFGGKVGNRETVLVFEKK